MSNWDPGAVGAAMIRMVIIGALVVGTVVGAVTVGVIWLIAG